MKETIKIMIKDISSSYSDELIDILIEEATNEIKKLRHSENVSEYAFLIGKMVRYKLNVIDKEGVSNENYTGANYSYTTDYPEHILRELRALKKVRFI